MSFIIIAHMLGMGIGTAALSVTSFRNIHIAQPRVRTQIAREK